jgi:hypothetical protein
MVENFHFSSSLIDLIFCFPSGVKTYSTPGGFSGSSRLIKPESSSSLIRLARVRRLIRGDCNESRSSLNFLGLFSRDSKIPFVPVLPRSSSNAWHHVPSSTRANLKYIGVTLCHLVYIQALDDIMPQARNKYPELVAYFKKRGYHIETDADLRDAHAWIPLELYVQLTTKACRMFGARGKISKAVAESLEKWLKEDKDA